MRPLAVQAQTSFVVRGLSGVLPAPTEIAAQLGRLLDDTGIPDLFVGLDPLPAPDVERPTDPAARQIAANAVGSTVRVSAPDVPVPVDRDGVRRRARVRRDERPRRSPARPRSGSRPQPAGCSTRWRSSPIRSSMSRSCGSRTSPSTPLRFAAVDPERGAVGATLGYPHGGGLLVEPAAVSGAYTAQGRDIYGAERVSRRILELRAVVDQGDSGGPLVLTDGTVGGVVFAEARTDESVGYALTATSVATAIQPSIGRTSPTDTGACIH